MSAHTQDNHESIWKTKCYEMVIYNFRSLRVLLNWICMKTGTIASLKWPFLTSEYSYIILTTPKRNICLTTFTRCENVELWHFVYYKHLHFLLLFNIKTIPPKQTLPHIPQIINFCEDNNLVSLRCEFATLKMGRMEFH